MSVLRRTSIVFATAVVGLLAAFDTARSDDGEVHYYLQQPASVSLASATVEADDDSDQDYGVRSPSDSTYADDSPCGDCSHGGGLDYFIVGRGAGTYYSVPGETKFGGAYGMQAGVHLIGDWGFLGSFDVNHLSHGTQFSGTTGFLKLSDPCGCSWWERSTFLATLDQFGDTRIDGMYLNQMRFLFGYPVSDRLSVGAIYSQPLNKAAVDVRFRSFPDFPFRGTIAMSQAISAFAAWQVRKLQLTANLGYRETSDEMTVGSGIRVLHSERLASFAAFNYGTDKATWGASAGIELRFGPALSSSGNCRTDVCYAPTSSPIVRAQSPPNTIRLASVPGVPGDQAITGETFSYERVNPTRVESPESYDWARRVWQSREYQFLSQPYDFLSHTGLKFVLDTPNDALTVLPDGFLPRTNIGVKVCNP